MKPVMYGIPNCDTIKKAKVWLEDHKVDFDFHNYKKEGIDKETLEAWVGQQGWEKLLNRRGTTWRKLNDEEKLDITDSKAVTLMAQYPSMIKRPVVQLQEELLIGFDENEYQKVFSSTQS